MSGMEIFMMVLASNPMARKLVNEVFSNVCERSEKCRRCVEARFNYWYMRWLLGALADPVEAARSIHGCLRDEMDSELLLGQEGSDG